VRKLLVVALVGLLAQLVDGALGMGYGVTSTTLLLLAGFSPASASASVHLAEIGTSLAVGVAHWRFGNVDWRVVARIAIPGAVGAFAGATFLSSISTKAAAPWMAGILFLLGCYLLLRFSRPLAARKTAGPLRTRFLGPLGLIAGFVDATGGGGWGPVSTPALLVSGRMEPRKVVGSVDTAQFVVAGAATIGFLLAMGSEGFVLPTVVALLIGGMIAAPIAAYLVRIVPAQLLGAAVGGLIVMTNARVIARTFGFTSDVTSALYVAVGVGWIVAFGFAVRALRRTRRQAMAAPAAATAAHEPAGAVQPVAVLDAA
jgi:uncharacterized protein